MLLRRDADEERAARFELGSAPQEVVLKRIIRDEHHARRPFFYERDGAVFKLPRRKPFGVDVRHFFNFQSRFKRDGKIERFADNIQMLADDESLRGVFYLLQQRG